jgi:hypothetical protein
MNLAEPWVLLRLFVSAIGVVLLLRASITAVRVLRSFDLMRASEGQLALERQLLLAGTMLRFAIATTLAGALLSFLLADRLYVQIQGAMCGYGVISATEYGRVSVVATCVAALGALTVNQVLAYDSQQPTLRLGRVVSFSILALLPLVVLEAALTAMHLAELDLSVITTCCSVESEQVVRGINGAERSVTKAWLLPTIALVFGSVLPFVASWRLRDLWVKAQGPLALVSGAAAVAAFVLLTAPHVFEVPDHRCPFCLFRADAYFLGYPLLTITLFGVARLLGLSLVAWFDAERSQEVWRSFARSRLRSGAIAITLAIALSLVPVLRYAVLTGGHTL